MGRLKLVANDPVAQAIKAAVKPPPVPAMAEFGLQLSSGRPAALMLPRDLTDAEFRSLLNGLLQIADQIAAARPASRIVVPR